MAFPFLQIYKGSNGTAGENVNYNVRITILNLLIEMLVRQFEY